MANPKQPEAPKEKDRSLNPKQAEAPKEKDRSLDGLLDAIENSNNQSALDVIDRHAQNALRANTISAGDYQKVQSASKKRAESFKKA
jgi:hypothetical protein